MTYPVPAPRSAFRLVASLTLMDRRGIAGTLGAMATLALVGILTAVLDAPADDVARFEAYEAGVGKSKLAAIRAGAYQVTMPDPSDPEYVLTVRNYPTSNGGNRREIVDRFKLTDFRRSGGYVPEPAVSWFEVRR